MGILANAGARLDIKNNFNKTPYDIAEDVLANDTILNHLRPREVLTPQQARSARTAQMVRQRSLDGSQQHFAASAPYMTAEELSEVLVSDARLSKQSGSCLFLAGVDSDLAKNLDDAGFREVGIESSLDRARIRTWLGKQGYV